MARSRFVGNRSLTLFSSILIRVLLALKILPTVLLRGGMATTIRIAKLGSGHIDVSRPGRSVLASHYQQHIQREDSRHQSLVADEG